MARQPLAVTLNLEQIHCHSSSEGTAEPYLWVVFFKIDGDTVTLTDALTVSGQATVQSTPGSHGNLGTTDVNPGDIVSIPSQLGQWKTVLRPITVPPSLKQIGIDDVAGTVGVIFILMEHDNVTDHGAEAGHDALNKGVRVALNQVIGELNAANREVTPDQIAKYIPQIETDIRNAIENAQNSWDDFRSWQDPDDTIGTAILRWNHDELVNSPTQIIDQVWENEGKWQLTGRVNAAFIQSADVLASYDGIIDIAASYHHDDSFRAVLVATRNGDIHEIFYQVSHSSQMPSGVGDSVIAHFDGIVAITAFYNEDDHNRVVIVATKDGNLWEVFYHPSWGVSQSIIANFGGVVDLAGFYAADNGFRTVLVATTGGVDEFFYHPVQGRGQVRIFHNGDTVAITGYYARNTGYRALKVATREGVLHYLYYHPTFHWNQGHNNEGAMIAIAGNDQDTFIARPDGTVSRLVAGGLRIDLATIPGIEHLAVDQWDSNNLIYSTSDGRVHKLLW